MRLATTRAGGPIALLRLRHLRLDTQREHVVVIHEQAVRAGNLGFNPLDRVVILAADPAGGSRREITGILNFCSDGLIEPTEIGLSDVAFRDLGLPEGASVQATLAPAPHSLDRVRAKLEGHRFDRAAFDAIVNDVVRHRYSKVELAMFVLACALRTLDLDETIDFTRAMIAGGAKLDFGAGPIADKHCVGGVPGHRTTMIVVPILVAHGVTMPKTSSRAITSPAGTADTMGVLADVSLSPERLHAIVDRIGGCIAWGGALDLAPADDILITVERPMEIDTEAQMVASILAKKKTAGATHVVIDLPVGPTAKLRSHAQAENLRSLFERVARAVDLAVDVVVTEVRGPIGRGIGPRLEALDVLAVLRRQADAPRDLREKALFLAGRLLEHVGAVLPADGYRAAQRALDDGSAERAFGAIVAAQGQRSMPPEAPHRHVHVSTADGRIRSIDCWEIARVAKRAGAPANVAAGVRLLRTVGDVVTRGEPLFEIHAQTRDQLEFARSYAARHPDLIEYGF
jgi:thymidine phosphorylase